MSSFAQVSRLAQNLARNNAWPVFPLGENKRPTWAKDDGGQGFHDASTDPERIDWLWLHHPGPLIGVPTGKASGVSVLDVDEKHPTARQWWWTHEHLLPTTRIFRTRGGGLHCYFNHADGVINNEGGLAKGIDTRGDGGYIVYWFAAGYECLDHSPPAAWPHWLSRELWPPPKPKPERRNSDARELSNKALDRIKQTAIDMVRDAPDGQKHLRVRGAARLLGGIQAKAGFTDSEAEDWLVYALPSSTVDVENARKTIAWGLRRGRGEPVEARP